MKVTKNAKIQLNRTKDTRDGETYNTRISLTKSLLDRMGFNQEVKVEYDTEQKTITIKPL